MLTWKVGGGGGGMLAHGLMVTSGFPQNTYMNT